MIEVKYMTDVPNTEPSPRKWYLPNMWQPKPTCSYSTSSQNDHLRSILPSSSFRPLSSWMDIILTSNTKQQKSPLHPEYPRQVLLVFSADRNVTFDAHALHDCVKTQTHNHTNLFLITSPDCDNLSVLYLICNWISQLLTPGSPLHGSCLSHTPRCLSKLWLWIKKIKIQTP
jgi:hypothetical protein